jgi:superfamily II DNA or RNA helicase
MSRTMAVPRTQISARKTPKPHQEEAVAATLAELSIAPRATAVLPCGSGKTLIELWVAEGLKAGTVVVFEPTRALIRQTLLVFREQAQNRTTRLLAVSSDSQGDSDSDDETLDAIDDDFEATTDMETVRRFLTEPGDHPRILIATYQSAHVVRAALTPAVAIDLAIFDEAHKTAGRAGKTFAAALDDAWLPITRRFFLTATPRHTEITGPDADRSEVVVYSMDNPALYGRVVYTLTYRDAVDRGIILPFKVVIAVVTHSEVAEAIGRDLQLDHPEGLSDISARQVAQWVALRKTMQEFNLKKAFSFHETIQAAKSFLEMESLITGPAGKRIDRLHINGKHNHTERAALFESFRSARCAVLTNARCLTEGVDVPSVDLCAFNSNRRSVTDIVQGTGRTQRHAEGKEAGYVLLPVFIDQREGETVEDAAERADLGEVGSVLRALAEQDDQIIAHIRIAGQPQGSRQNRGTGTTSGADLVSLRVFGDGIDISKISTAITTRVLTRICSTWDDYYERLRLGVLENGTGWVPRRQFANTYDAFADWVAKQRCLGKNGKLSAERTAKLTKLDFPWVIKTKGRSNQTNRLLDILKALPREGEKLFDLYHREHQLDEEARELLGTVRQALKRGSIEEDTQIQLNTAGMVWETMAAREKRFLSQCHTMLHTLKKELRHTFHTLLSRPHHNIYTLEEWEKKEPEAVAVYNGLLSHPYTPSGKSVAYIINDIRLLLEPTSWEQALAISASAQSPIHPVDAEEIIMGIIRRRQRGRLEAVKRESAVLVQSQGITDQERYDRLHTLCLSLLDPEIARKVIIEAAPTLESIGFSHIGKYNAYYSGNHGCYVHSPEVYTFTNDEDAEISKIQESCVALTGETIKHSIRGTLKRLNKIMLAENTHLSDTLYIKRLPVACTALRDVYGTALRAVEKVKKRTSRTSVKTSPNWDAMSPHTQRLYDDFMSRGG